MPKKKILIIDDEKIVCAGLKKELTESGEFDVDCALSGEQGIEKTRSSQPFDLIFIDLIMPGIDGVETCRILNRVSPKSKLVCFTGLLDKSTIFKEVEFAKAGGEGRALYKPFLNNEVLHLAHKILK